MLNVIRTGAANGSSMSQVVEITRQKQPQVSKTRFIGRDHRSGMFDAWLSGNASMWQLMRRNGLTLNEVEDALREEFVERRLRAERIERQRAVLLQMPRHSGDTGPLAGPSAVRPTHFGGMLLNAIGMKRAA
jgi:hypothetical protein